MDARLNRIETKLGTAPAPEVVKPASTPPKTPEVATSKPGIPRTAGDARETISPTTPKNPTPKAKDNGFAPATDGSTKAYGFPTVEKPVHNFGEVWAGPVLSHTFAMRNTGSKPLRITNVKPECGCTSAGDYPKVIAPGAVGRFPFSLKTLKLTRNTRKSVRISTDTPGKPLVTLTLLADVKKSLDYESWVLIRAMPKDTTSQQKIVSIRNYHPDPVSISMEPVKNKSFSASLEEVDPGRQFKLTLNSHPPYKIGYERETLTFKTDAKGVPEFTIRANLHVPDRIEVVPSQLVVSRTGPRTRTISITNYGETPVAVRDITVDDPLVKTRLTEKEPGKKYSLLVTFPNGYMPPSSGKRLTIKLDDARKPIVNIPIRQNATNTTRKPTKRPAELLVGKPAPEFELATTGGKEVSSRSVGDAPATVLNFFAPNCGFCKRQIPVVNQVRSQFQGSGIRFVNVSERMRKDYTQDEVLSVLDGIGSTLDVAIDSGNLVGRSFKATSYPTLVVVDRKGEIRAVTVGAKKNLNQMLSETLEELLND
ncbi:MAG: DUF1573 domain-containing protein [Planctomycetota bacterium]